MNDYQVLIAQTYSREKTKTHSGLLTVHFDIFIPFNWTFKSEANENIYKPANKLNIITNPLSYVFKWFC